MNDTMIIIFHEEIVIRIEIENLKTALQDTSRGTTKVLYLG